MRKNDVMNLIDRVERYPGFACEDKNVQMAFANFQEIMAGAIRKLLAKAESQHDERMRDIYIQEIRYMIENIKHWANFID
tara:strand:+ start:5232 stop:5471 length:240 start_codon:yes stop_codon:yes gene_type:complete